MVLKVYRFQKRVFLLTVHRVNWRQQFSASTQLWHWQNKNKQNDV